LFAFISIFREKINIPKTTLISFYSVKGTASGWAPWGANTFPTRNRLPGSQSGFHRSVLSLFSLVFHSFPRKLWWWLPSFRN